MPITQNKTGGSTPCFLKASLRAMYAYGYERLRTMFGRRESAQKTVLPLDECQVQQAALIARMQAGDVGDSVINELITLQTRRVDTVAKLLDYVSEGMSSALYNLDLCDAETTNDARLCSAMGQLQEWYSNPKSAISWYRRATQSQKTEPEDEAARSAVAEAAFRQARLLVPEGRHDEAQELIDRAIALQPTDPRFYNLAWLNLTMWDRPNEERAADAVAFLDEALRSDHLLEAQVADLHQTLMICSNQFRQMQEQAADNNIPGILLNTLARSASTYIMRRVSHGMGVPSCQIEAMTGPRRLIPAAIERLKMGGTICRVHLPAEPQIFDDLRAGNLTKMVFHIRDPRDACLSLVHQNTLYGAETGVEGAYHVYLADKKGMFSADLEQRITKTIKHYVGPMCERIHGWIDVSRENGGDFDILFTTYDELRGDEDAFFKRILEFYNMEPPEFPNTVAPKKSRAENYRHGHQGHWREVFSEEHKALMWDLIPPSLAERFGWEK